MKICILSSQILGEKKIGGFGSMTLQLAYALTQKNHEVVVVIPNKTLFSQKSYTKNNVQFYEISFLTAFFTSFFKKLNVEVYHSQNPTLLTLAAQFKSKTSKHIITCRDPRDAEDWKLEFKYATWKRRFKTPINYFVESSFLISKAIKNADVVACPSQYLVDKIKRMYGDVNPMVLHNIERIPKNIPLKPLKPTVCWVGRFARRKNPEDFIRLALLFPNVDFLIMGKAEEVKRQEQLNKMMSDVPNLTSLGFKNKFNDPTFFDIYNKSWILINTAKREGLPVSFGEALSRGCALLSTVNPNNFTSLFGYHVNNGDFEEGLKKLLNNDLWLKKSQLGFNEMQSNHSYDISIEKHEEVYKKTYI